MSYHLNTIRGYSFPAVSSAMQKAIRRGDAKLAGYWALELWASGFGQYVWRRLQDHQSVEIEYGLLRVTALPSLGGRIYQIEDLTTGGRASLEAALVAHFDNSTACHLDTLLKEQGDHAARQQLLARWTDPADFRHGETEADVLLDIGKPQACLDLLETRQWTRHRRTKLWVGAREALGLAATPVPASLGEDPYVVGH